MKVTETKLQGCYIIEPTVFEDKRGSFYESFNAASFLKHTNQKVNFVQDNESCSAKGVLRGLHYQRGEYAQAKLVRVLEGTVLDIVVDIRKESKTFGEHFSIELSSENKKQLFIPRGFAHGFIVLSESATFFYKCDNYYNKESEGGIIYNDIVLQIDWKLGTSEVVISEKDTQLPTFENCLL
jgi:dTDP-4-dehydrorhamnose 3,5-epimerase